VPDAVLTLPPDQGATGRAFTDPALAVEDLGAVARIRASLVTRMRANRSGGTWTTSGESHWLVVPRLRPLTNIRPAFGVGFFGQAREQVDHRAILELEQALLARAAALPGLLAYYNVRFRTGQWGNLVLFASKEGAGHVRADPTHLEALAITAHHYRSVRLHRLRFPDGALGGLPPTLESTILIDFSETPPWRAVRLGPR
jgi:hypothetical protein